MTAVRLVLKKLQSVYQNYKDGWQNGYLTVYVALSMTVMISLCLTLIEGARRNAIRMESEVITEIGLDSILAEYHIEMLKQYHLFFIDTSYGTSQPSLVLTQEHLTDFIQHNCDLTQVFLEGLFYRDFLAMEVESAAITETSTASDQNGLILRRQAVETIKEDFGITYLQNIQGWLSEVEGYGLAQRDVEQEKKAVDGQIDAYNGTEKQLSEKEWTKIEIQNPTQRLETQKSKGILSLVLKNTDTISKAGVELGGLFSDRKKQGLLNSGNAAVEGEKESLIDKLLFQEYLLRYTGHYGSELEKGLLQYQAEYLIAGKDNDMENLKGVISRISAIREAANAMYLFSDETKCAEAQIVAAAAASAMLVPEITTLLKITILLGWAYAESLYDVRQLLNGGRVPLLKNAQNWHYGIECVSEGNVNDDVISVGEGLSYEDYIRILLALTGTEKITDRFMDIVEMDIRMTPGNSRFRIDGCVDHVKATVDITSKYGYQYTISRRRGYEIY